MTCQRFLTKSLSHERNNMNHSSRNDDVSQDSREIMLKTMRSRCVFENTSISMKHARRTWRSRSELDIFILFRNGKSYEKKQWKDYTKSGSEISSGFATGNMRIRLIELFGEIERNWFFGVTHRCPLRKTISHRTVFTYFLMNFIGWMKQIAKLRIIAYDYQDWWYLSFKVFDLFWEIQF